MILTFSVLSRRVSGSVISVCCGQEGWEDTCYEGPASAFPCRLGADGVRDGVETEKEQDK